MSMNFGLVDPSISSQTANALAQEYSTQGQMNRLALQKAQTEQKNAMIRQEILSKVKDPRSLVEQYRGAGLHEDALDIESKMTANRTKELQNLKLQGEVADKAATSVMANPTLQNAINVVQKSGSLLGVDVSSDISELQAIGDNPEAIHRWAAGHAAQAKDLMGQFKEMDLGDRKLIGRATWDGRFAPKQEFMVGASPNSPKTTINIGSASEEEYGKKFAAKAAERDIGLMETAEKAPEMIATAKRINDLVSGGNVITGFGAPFRLQVAKALNIGGSGDNERIANTEILIASLKKQVLDAVKSSGLGSGQGFTDKDREFLEDTTGKVGNDSASLKRLAELAQKAGVSSIEKWNRRSSQIPESALRGTGIIPGTGIPPGVGGNPGLPPGLPPGMPPGLPPATRGAGGPVIPDAAIADLRQGRGTPAQFDAVFGPGAAAGVLRNTAKPPRGTSGGW